MFKKNILSIVYGFDNENELKFFELSLKTLIKTNGKKFIVYCFVNSEKLKQEVNNIYKKNDVYNIFKIIKIDNIGYFRKQGKFFWLRSPFYIKSKFILQLDCDTLINTNLMNLLPKKNSLNWKMVISGVKIKTPENVLSSLIENHNFNPNSSQNFFWINAGIVLINVKKYKSKFKKLETLENELILFSRVKSKKRISQSDEAFIIKKFKKIGTLKRRYNLRFQAPKTTLDWINSDDFIFHYNLRKKINKNFVKYDFSKFIIMKNDFSEESNNLKKFILDVMKLQENTFFEQNSIDEYLKKIILSLYKLMS